MSWDWSPTQLAGLSEYLRRRGICDGPLTARRIGDGHSNLTYLVTDGDRQAVVRRPPPPPFPPGAHDMLREARLLEALAGTDVPVADVLAVAEAGEVLDVAFYVMSYVEGPVVTTETPAPLDAAQERQRIGTALVDSLVALHAVDWQARGLSGLGRPEGFNRHHYRRMGRLIADAGGNPPPAFAEIDQWLGVNVPPEAGAAIVHNDFRIGNVVLGPDRPGRIIAVLDWELATIGDPLFDVGYFLASYPVPGETLTPTGQFGTAVLEAGYPTREELSRRYADATGRDLSNLQWYTALAQWKLAVLYEYGRRRYATGDGDSYYENPRLVEAFLAAAHEAAGLTPPAPAAGHQRQAAINTH